MCDAREFCGHQENSSDNLFLRITISARCRSNLDLHQFGKIKHLDPQAWTSGDGSLKDSIVHQSDLKMLKIIDHRQAHEIPFSSQGHRNYSDNLTHTMY
jgi:hypothetical protein